MLSTMSFVLGILLITVLLPTWIVFHYITKWKAMKGLSTEDESLMAELWESARRMEARIENLEKAMDLSPHTKPTEPQK